MPFDDKLWDKPAIQADVAGIALYASAALTEITAALEALKEGKDIDEYIREIQSSAKELDNLFIELSGWTKE